MNELDQAAIETCEAMLDDYVAAYGTSANTQTTLAALRRLIELARATSAMIENAKQIEVYRDRELTDLLIHEGEGRWRVWGNFIEYPDAISAFQSLKGETKP